MGKFIATVFMLFSSLVLADGGPVSCQFWNSISKKSQSLTLPVVFKQGEFLISTCATQPVSTKISREDPRALSMCMTYVRKDIIAPNADLFYVTLVETLRDEKNVILNKYEVDLSSAKIQNVAISSVSSENHQLMAFCNEGGTHENREI